MDPPKVWPKAPLHNGSMLLALNPPPDPGQAIPADHFSESRIGLDHLSLGMADLEAAASLFDEMGRSHGESKPLAPFGIAAEQGEMAFRARTTSRWS